MFRGDEGLQKKNMVPRSIQSRSYHLIETDNLIFTANQLTGFYMMGTFNLNRLRGVSLR